MYYGAAGEGLQFVKFLVWAVLNAFVVQIINNSAIHSARLRAFYGTDAELFSFWC
jgi:hypothetical protein